VILLAYQLAKNWDGQIQLCMAVPDAETGEKAEQYLRELIQLARLPADTTIAVLESAFTDAVATLPRADLNIFGLPKPAQISFCRHIASLVDSSAMFVRDSGDESALA
jgi:solute carrier family 12 sodium/potassium/chloride transporter 2